MGLGDPCESSAPSSRISARDEVALPYTVDQVYAALVDFSSYKEWWPRHLAFEVLGPLPVALGTRVRFGNTRFVSWTGVVTEVRERATIVIRYDGGACEGRATWTLEEAGAATRIAYAIDLELRPLWLRLLSRLVDFPREHHRQISRVFAALDRRILELN